MRTMPSGDESTAFPGTLASDVEPRRTSICATPSERVTVNGPPGTVGGKVSPAAVKLATKAVRCVAVAVVGSEPIRRRQQFAPATNSVYHSKPAVVTRPVQLSRVATLPVQATCHQRRVRDVPPGISTALRFSALPVAIVTPVVLSTTVNDVGLPIVTLVVGVDPLIAAMTPMRIIPAKPAGASIASPIVSSRPFSNRGECGAVSKSVQAETITSVPEARLVARRPRRMKNSIQIGGALT